MMHAFKIHIMDKKEKYPMQFLPADGSHYITWIVRLEI